DQAGHWREGHGGCDPRAWRDTRSDRQLDFRRAAVHAHGWILLSVAMKKWHYNSALDLGLSPTERWRHFPREPDMLVYSLRALLALIIRGLLRLYHRF